MNYTRHIGALVIGLTFTTGAIGQAGTLDPDFSANGYTTVDFAEGDVDGQAVAYTSNGDIYVAGTLRLPSESGGSIPTRRMGAIIRLNEDGSLDNGFSGNGRLLFDYYDRGISENPWSFIRAIAVGSDGDLVVVGETSEVNLAFSVPSTSRFGIARFNSDGSPDTDFSDDGFARVSFNADAESRPWDVVIQSDGKMVVAGWTNVDSDDDSELNFAVTRLNTNGSLDNSFSSNGTMQVDFGVYDSYAHALAIQSDGKIVVAGTYDFSDGDSKMVVARLNSNGTLDNSFNGTGKYQNGTSTTFIDNAWALTIDAAGKIVVGGEWQYSDGSGYIQPILFRLTTAGTLDNSFSSNGEFNFTGPQGHGAAIRKLDVQCDGKIIATGYSVDTDDDQDMLIARITSSGDLDDSFASEGMATLAFGFGHDSARGLSTRSSDQYITIAGSATVAEEALVFGVARYRTETGIVPSAPTITFNEEECELNASGTGTFNWQNELIAFPPLWISYATGNPVGVTAADDYRVRVTAANGCVSPWSDAYELDEPCMPFVDCNGVQGGPDVEGAPCDDGSTATGNDAWNANCVCEGEPIDCEGVTGGPALPTTPCDDGNTSTANDVWNASCVCVGNDCAGVPGGNALPGSPCDDGDENTGDDAWTSDCDCVGLTIDCEGVVGGPALPGTTCDDGNSGTVNDTWIIGCTCIGAVGIEEAAGAVFGVGAYPVPFQDVLTVVYTLKESASMGIELRDLSGRMLAVLLPVMHRPVGEQRLSLRMPQDLAHGTYWLVLSGDAGRAAVRVTK